MKVKVSTALGLALALVSGVFKSTKSITTKIASVGTDEYVTGFATRFIGAVVFLIIVVCFQDPYIPENKQFWIVLLVNSILLGLVTILFARALKISDVSVVSPIMATLPVFVTIPAYFVLGEIPTFISGVGLVLVVVGAYSLNLNGSTRSYVEPIYAITNDRGVQFAFVGLVLAGLIPSLDKVGIENSDPVTWVLFQHAGSGIFILIVILIFSRTSTVGRDSFKILLVVGISNAFIWVLQGYAYEMTQVSYVQAIKRVSILISVSIGYYYFDEKGIKERLFGSFLILSGVLLIIAGSEII